MTCLLKMKTPLKAKGGYKRGKEIKRGVVNLIYSGGNMASNHDKDSSNKGGTSNRGFASMDDDKQREIASKGGKAAHEKGSAHEFNSEEAREAGRKGGHAAHEKGTAHEFDSEEAREAGRKGGQNSHGGSHAESKGSHDYEGSSSATRGGSHEQHAKAGSQSHKNK